MTIAETLLPKLNEWQTAGEGRQYLAQALETTGWTLQIAADRVDTLGCLVWELTLSRANAVPMANALLKERALRIAEQATGLMEPLTFLELDELRGEALLRSDTPSKRAASLAYYELLMTAGRIAVHRYKRSADSARREQVAFALTHESIAKLVDDLMRA